VLSRFPEVAVRNELAAGSLCEIAVNGLSIYRTFSLVSRRGRDPSPSAAFDLVAATL
jgi:hypothetical protein